MGMGRTFEQAPKQKLNTKSSTEAEIVGVSNYLPNFIWARVLWRFKYLQSNKISFSKTTKMQLKLKRIERRLVKKNKHMENRYFWIKDRLQYEEIKVDYRPTEKK